MVRFVKESKIDVFAIPCEAVTSLYIPPWFWLRLSNRSISFCPSISNLETIVHPKPRSFVVAVVSLVVFAEIVIALV
jgi:hypothetical protein